MAGHAILKAPESRNGRTSRTPIIIPAAQHDAQNGRLRHAKSGTALNPAAKRSIPGLVSSGKCKNRTAAQGITTFPDFRAEPKHIVGIIVCSQNSHSRPGKTRDCQFWRGQNHRSIRRFKFKLISGNDKTTVDFQRFGLAERLGTCIDRQPIILRRCCGRRMLEEAEFCVSPKDL